MTVRKTMSVFLLMIAISFTANIKSLFAETRYVSDRLIVSVRDGTNQDDNVLGYIRTGEAVDVLEERERYLRIRTEDGLEGWVQGQYITSENPDGQLIQDLRRQINELNNKIELLKNEKDTLSEKLMVKKQINEVKIKELEKELNISQKNTAKAKNDLIELDKKYKKLLSDSENTDELIMKLEKSKKLDSTLKNEISNLKKKFQTPRKSNIIKPFLAGAGVFLIGFILGAITKRKKTSKYY